MTESPSGAELGDDSSLGSSRLGLVGGVSPNETFPPGCHGAERGMRADGESGEQQWRQQQQRRGRRSRRRWGGRRRRRRGGNARRAAREEPAAFGRQQRWQQQQRAAGGEVPRRAQGSLLLAALMPLQAGVHQQHRIPHVRLQGEELLHHTATGRPLLVS